MLRNITLKTNSEKRFDYWKKKLEGGKVEYKEEIKMKIFGNNIYQVKFIVDDHAIANCLGQLLIPEEGMEFYYGE